MHALILQRCCGTMQVAGMPKRDRISIIHRETKRNHQRKSGDASEKQDTRCQMSSRHPRCRYTEVAAVDKKKTTFFDLAAAIAMRCVVCCRSSYSMTAVVRRLVIKLECMTLSGLLIRRLITASPSYHVRHPRLISAASFFFLFSLYLDSNSKETSLFFDITSPWFMQVAILGIHPAGFGKKPQLRDRTRLRQWTEQNRTVRYSGRKARMGRK